MNKLILVSQFFYSVWLSRSDLVDSGKNKSNSFNEILTDQDLYSILKKRSAANLTSCIYSFENQLHVSEKYTSLQIVKTSYVKNKPKQWTRGTIFFSILFNKFIHLSSMITNEAKQKCSNITCNANSPVWPATLGVQWSKPVLQIKLM